MKRAKRPPRTLHSPPPEGAQFALGTALRAKDIGPVVPKVRNPVARSPLMGKGGAHGKTTRAKRRLAKMELAKVDPRGEKN